MICAPGVILVLLIRSRLVGLYGVLTVHVSTALSTTAPEGTPETENVLDVVSTDGPSVMAPPAFVHVDSRSMSTAVAVTFGMLRLLIKISRFYKYQVCSIRCR